MDFFAIDFETATPNGSKSRQIGVCSVDDNDSRIQGNQCFLASRKEFLKIYVIIILGLLTFLFSCSKNDNRDKNVVELENGIIAFDDFDQVQFDDEKAFELFQEATRETKNGNFGLAKTLLENAIEIEPKNRNIHNALGLTEFQLKNYEAGIGHLENTFHIDSTYLEAYTNMAAGENSLGAHQKSIDHCNFAIEKSDKRMVLCAAYFNKSIAEHALNDLDKAISDITKAIEFSDDENLSAMLTEVKSNWLSERNLHEVLRGDGN